MLICSGLPQRRPASRNQKILETSDVSHRDVFQQSQSNDGLQLIPRPNALRSAPLQAQIDDHIRKYNLPSQAAAILRDDSLEIAVAGRLHRESDVSVTTDSKYHLGSCTKMMTATMLARLVEKGKLKWSTTVSEAFPDFAPSIHPQLKNVTLEMLTTHRSGLTKDINSFEFHDVQRAFQHELPREELVKKALRRAPLHTPGKVYEYSNIGYTVAGAMAESVTGMSWEELMRQELFEPLEMDTAGFGPAGESEPWGHGRKGEPVRPNWSSFWTGEQKSPPDNPPVIGPAGTVHSTVEDWAKFVQAQGRRDESFLSSEMWDYLQTPRPGEHYTPGGWLTGVNEHFKTEDGDLYHNGSNTMFYSFVRLRVGSENQKPEAVLLVSNELNPESSHSLADKVLG